MPPALLRSLSHRNFRLFFLGQTVSLIGTWMQQVAMSWLMLLLAVKTGRDPAWWLGVVGFASQIPSFLFAPLAGVVVDHVNRHRLVIATQTVAMLQAFILTALTLLDVVEIWHVVVLSVVVGLVNAFDMPGRQAFLTEMIDTREDLPNAIALNSSMFNGARFFGPMLAGAILAWKGAGICFFINALSFIAVILALFAMRVPPRGKRRGPRRLLRGMREGFSYAFGFPPIRSLLLLVAAVSMLGMFYSVLLPIFATRVLAGDATTLGFLMSAAGIGALTGALLLAARKTVLGLGRWVMLMPAALGLAMIGLSFSGSLAPALASVLLAGFAMMMQMASSNTIIQTIVDEEMRGRVMSFYTMAFMGAAPLGSLLAGSLAEQIGAPESVRLAGFCCIIASLVFATQFRTLRDMIRPIYRRIGILPEVAAGIQEASQLTTPPEGK